MDEEIRGRYENLLAELDRRLGVYGEDKDEVSRAIYLLVRTASRVRDGEARYMTNSLVIPDIEAWNLVWVLI